MKKEVSRVGEAVREGRFQRWLSLIAGVSAVLSGIEVAYEHYRGSYSRRVMYTPVILSGAMTIAGVAGFANKRAAKGAVALYLHRDTRRRHHRVLFPHARYREETRRLAASPDEYRDGAAHLRTVAVRSCRLSGVDSLFSAARRRERNAASPSGA